MKTWLMYLRKSRQDDPRETVEEVLAKHEQILQEYAVRELGKPIPPEHIYREVVSGESIDDRVEIQKVLARIEDPQIAGVLVVEPTRLSRGDLEDCSRIIKAFRFSRTLIHTPVMTYDLEKKMERKFFQDELLRGNDFLEYIKERLWFGRVAAAKRGVFLNRVPPFGYDKVRKGKECTLEPNAAADTVRLIFKMFDEDGLSPGQIARKLNEMGLKTSTGLKWIRDRVYAVLTNKHYAGWVVYNYRKSVQVLEDGVITKKRRASDEDTIIAPGLHTALVDQSVFDRVQAKLRTPDAKTKRDTTLQNPFAGVLFCGKCGKALRRGVYSHSASRLFCRSSPTCYKSTTEQRMLDAVIFALENSELPALEQKLVNGDGNARKIQERMLVRLEKEMEDLQGRKNTLYDLLESGRYSPDVFDERMAVLMAKIEECQASINRTRSTMPEHVDYQERIVAMKDAIRMLKDDGASAELKNKAVKAIIKRINYTGPAPRLAEAGFGQTPFTIEIILKL